MYCSNEPLSKYWHLDHSHTYMSTATGKISGKEALKMWDSIANWSWKLGFDYVSIIFWGEPKFPMPKED